MNLRRPALRTGWKGRSLTSLAKAPSLISHAIQEHREKETISFRPGIERDARARFPTSTLADLYDPVAMPPALAKTHAELDRAVDRCYRAQKFENDRQRVEYLFAVYEKLTAPLVAAAAPRKRARRPAAT
jgi:hypothetical protein